MRVRSTLAKPLSMLGAGLGAIAIAIPVHANHAWGGFHWSRTTTLAIRLADNVGPAWDAHLQAASTDWTAAAQIDAPVVAGSRNPATCDPTYGRIEVCSYAYGSTGWLGLANVWSSGGHVVQATARLNDTYFANPQYNTADWRRSVMCQEIGHAFGLDHQDIDQTNANLGSCMDYTSDPSGTRGTNGTASNQRPNQHDFDQLNAIYAHVDSTQLSSTRPTAAGSAVQAADDEPGRSGAARQMRAAGNTPGEWGRAVAQDRKGRGRIFVRELEGGVTLTTFVTWADADHPHEH